MEKRSSGQIFIGIGSLLAFTAVAMGAFAAHGLKNVLEPQWLEIIHTGVFYQLVHAVALVLVGVMAGKTPERPLLRWAGWLFVVGCCLFSGSLYVLALSGVRLWGMITPVGGVSLLGGWAALAAAAFRAET